MPLPESRKFEKGVQITLTVSVMSSHEWQSWWRRYELAVPPIPRKPLGWNSFGAVTPHDYTPANAVLLVKKTKMWVCLVCISVNFLLWFPLEPLEDFQCFLRFKNPPVFFSSGGLKPREGKIRPKAGFFRVWCLSVVNRNEKLMNFSVH